MNSMEKMKLLPLEERKYMQQLFTNCTKEVLENMVVMQIRKESDFIVAGEKCRSIFVILSGRARGIDMQIQGKVYTFKEFGPGRVLGEFECLSGIPEYSITIRTITDCIFWVIPSSMYLRWMKKDRDALFLRTQKLLSELTYQTMEDRKNLLINCDDRLILYFLEQYEKHHEKGCMVIRKNRDDIASTIGFCVKTINRNIKKLKIQNYISVKAGKICISASQYEAMMAYTQKNLL